MTANKNIIIPSEGMWLCNGITASQKVYLGCNDSIDNWYEITEDQAQEYLNEPYSTDDDIGGDLIT